MMKTAKEMRAYRAAAAEMLADHPFYRFLTPDVLLAPVGANGQHHKEVYPTDDSDAHPNLSMLGVRPINEHRVLGAFLDIDLISSHHTGGITPDEMSWLKDVRKALAALRDKSGFGAKTYNHYLSALNTFGKWLTNNKRVSSNPFVDIKPMNAKADVRKERRALTGDEFNRLVKTAAQSPRSIQCYAGPQRAMIYQIAGYTGLRRSEIASLTPESFNFKAKQITVAATISKHRREDVLPIHANLLEVVKPFVRTIKAGQPLFPKLAKRKTFQMMEKDLAAAGIEYNTPEGTADFHAVRHTFITGLMNSGATVLDTMKLARHSEISMTQKYSHVDQDRQSSAMNKLGYQGAAISNLTENGCTCVSQWGIWWQFQRSARK